MFSGGMQVWRWQNQEHIRIFPESLLHLQQIGRFRMYRIACAKIDHAFAMVGEQPFERVEMEV